MKDEGDFHMAFRLTFTITYGNERMEAAGDDHSIIIKDAYIIHKKQP